MPDPSVLKTKNALVLKKDPVCSHTATTLDALYTIASPTRQNSFGGAAPRQTSERCTPQ